MVTRPPRGQGDGGGQRHRNSFLPFHPGAVRYYKEKGIKLDPGALPK